MNNTYSKYFREGTLMEQLNLELFWILEHCNDAYIEKFTQIFKTANIKSVTVVVMEVPCCQGLPVIVREGMERAGKNMPIEKIVISADGEILQRGLLAA